MSASIVDGGAWARVTASSPELAFLSSEEAAQILGITARGVQKLVRSGALPAYRLSHDHSRLRIASSDLAEYLTAHRVKVETRG